jgi:hypothetical protein
LPDLRGRKVPSGRTFPVDWVIFSVTSTSYSNYFRVPIRSWNPYADGMYFPDSSSSGSSSLDMCAKITFGD